METEIDTEVEMTLTILREVDEELTIPIVVEVVYYPAQDGVRWGHPDNWTEEIRHDMDILSATSDDKDVTLTKGEERELLDLAKIAYVNSDY